jgi:hypothetical protein
MGENRAEYRGRRKDKGVVCLKSERSTKTDVILIQPYTDKEMA